MNTSQFWAVNRYVSALMLADYVELPRSTRDWVSTEIANCEARLGEVRVDSVSLAPDGIVAVHLPGAVMVLTDLDQLGLS